MKYVEFLRLGTTQQEAQEVRANPTDELTYYGSIHFKPKDRKPYNLATASTVSLDFDAGYIVYIVPCDHGDRVDVTANVRITPFTENGVQQYQIRIAHLNEDFSDQLVYFAIDITGADEKYYYSNFFYCTAEGIDKTTRVDFVDPLRSLPVVDITDKEPVYQSLRLAFYFSDHVDQTEVQNYYQITTEQNVIERTMLKELDEYEAELMSGHVFKHLSRSLYGGLVYFDFTRVFPVGVPEYQKPEGRLNVSQQTFVVDPDETDIRTIADVVITPTVTFIDWVVNSNPAVPVNNALEYPINLLQIPLE